MSSRKTTPNPEANLHVKMLHLIKLANIHLNHFPKYEKYGLSQQIRQCMYGIYDLITECQKRYHKKTSLTSLDIQHEQLRMLFKLAFELKYYEYKDAKNQLGERESLRRYQAMSSLVNEVGAMIGGWIKSEKE